MSTSRFFLDASSTAPLNSAASDALSVSLADGWADPTRLYHEGRRARLLADAAREAIASRIGAKPDELRFTSGMRASLEAALGSREPILASAVERSEILRRATATVPVNLAGRVDPEQFLAAIRPDTQLAALQFANSETGTTQPVAEVMAGKDPAAPLLVDANNAVGVLGVPDWDVLVAGANGWGGPADVALLAVKRSLRWAPAGLDEPSVPLLVAAAAGLEFADDRRQRNEARLRAMTTRLREMVPRTIEDVEVVGDAVNRLPHILTFSCLYVDGEALVIELDRRGFAVASGSACASEDNVPSHVLAAMGVFTGGNVRVSLPLDCTQDTVDAFLKELPHAVAAVREVLS